MALSAAGSKQPRLSAAVGFVSALVADADVLISASDDSLLQLEAHRHVTHALAFIPVGALIAAAALWVGPQGMPGVILIAATGAIIVLMVSRIGRGGLRADTRIAFGPFIALGLWVGWLHGPLSIGIR